MILTPTDHPATEYVYLRPGFAYPPCLCVGCGGPKAFAGWGRVHPGQVVGRSYGGWMDHTYRLTNNGYRVWVAEPYGLHSDSIEDLARIEAAGFRVTVSAEMARHAPGRTVAVVIFEPGTPL